MWRPLEGYSINAIGLDDIGGLVIVETGPARVSSSATNLSRSVRAETKSDSGSRTLRSSSRQETSNLR